MTQVSSFQLVSVSALKPNPFRRLDEYPIIREKVDALKESITATSFWGNIVCRESKGKYEIAFGHHRLHALQELGTPKKVEVIVRDLSNEQMLQMMARENMEEWGTSAWVELETIRATIEAYGKGLIELPKVPEKTRQDAIRHVGQKSGPHAFTASTVAEFLGWVRKHHDNGVRPNEACETAFRALDMLDSGFLAEDQLRGLQRAQLAHLVREQWSVYQSHKKRAEAMAKDAEAARLRAAQAPNAKERQRSEQAARVLESQSDDAAREAVSKAKEFGKKVSDGMRSGNVAIRDAHKIADDFKPRYDERVIDLEQLAKRTATALLRIANDDQLVTNFELLTANRQDINAAALASLTNELQATINRLMEWKKSLSVR